MQQTIVFHEDSDVLEVVATGRASVEGYRALIEAILAHPRFRKHGRVLVDKTQLAMTHLPQHELREIARHFARMSAELGNGRAAILVATDVAFGIVRMWEAYVEGHVEFGTRAFRSRDEALAWLAGMPVE
jgi:SpoIIAA-like